MEIIPQHPMAPLKEPKKFWFSYHHTATTVLIAVGILLIATALAWWQWPKSAEKPGQVTNQNQNPAQTDPTANWQTYHNQKYGFEFKYPESFVEDEEAPAKDNDPALECFKSNNVNGTVFCVLMLGTFDLKEIQQKYAPTGQEDFPKKIILGDKTFYMYGPGGGGVRYPDKYFYNLNGKILAFHFDDQYYNDKTPSPETKELAKQILATLVVNKKSTINSFESCVAAGYPILESYPEKCKTPDGRTFTKEISGWKNYNSQHGLTFKYPPSWHVVDVYEDRIHLKVYNQYYDPGTMAIPDNIGGFILDFPMKLESGKTLEQTAKEECKYEDEKLESLQVASYQAYRCSFIGQASNNYFGSYYIEKDNDDYLYVTAIGFDPQVLEVIATFKFTK